MHKKAFGLAAILRNTHEFRYLLQKATRDYNETLLIFKRYRKNTTRDMYVVGIRVYPLEAIQMECLHSLFIEQ